MTSVKWNEEEDEKILNEVVKGNMAFKISRKGIVPGRSVDAIKNRIAKLKENPKHSSLFTKVEKEKIEEQTSTKIDKSFSKDSGVLTTRSLDIKTLEDALRVSDIDLIKWEVERYIINSWEVTMGADSSGTGNPETFTNYQVKVWLNKKVFSDLDLAIDNICDKISKNSILVPTPKKSIISKDECIHELCLFDVHYGKYAWMMETGENYDIKIADKKYLDSVADLLNKGKMFNTKKIYLPLGQDFLHINNPENETAKGTRQDHDGRLIKVFESAIQTCINAIKMCSEICPVEVLWVPGNHDAMTSYYLCRVLKAYFEKTKHVEIDISPKLRKYIKYGINLIGYTHGSEEKFSDLPTIMASEQPTAWGETKIREWHVGHRHAKRQMSYTTGDTFNSVHVTTIPSFTSTDAWHYKKGYVKTLRVAQSFIWSKEKGNIAFFYTDYEDEDLGKE